jgi:hypothetical protein
MIGTRRRLALLAIPALAASVAMAPAASAQSPTPEPGTCEILTVEEVASAFAAADVTLREWSNGYTCAFGGDVSLEATIQSSQAYEDVRSDPSVGEEVTAGGRPAWLESPSDLWVDLGGYALRLAGSSSGEATDEATSAALVALAEIAVPRMPPGPGEDDIAAIGGFIPDTIEDRAVTLQYLPAVMITAALDAEDPDVVAFNDALAVQGLEIADVTLATGQREDSFGVDFVVARFEGADASALIMPFIDALSPEAMTEGATTTDIGGKSVTVAGTDAVVYAYANGDIGVFYGSVDDSEEARAAFFASLP